MQSGLCCSASWQCDDGRHCHRCGAVRGRRGPLVVVHRGADALLSPATIYDPATFSLKRLMLGAAIAILSYIGFDAISTLAEDTIHPEREISVATVLVCLVAWSRHACACQSLHGGARVAGL